MTTHGRSFAREGDAGWWDSMAGTLDEAKWAVWSVPPEKYEETTEECVAVIRRFLPERPARLLDVGCGVGRLTIPMARHYPDAEVVGEDVAAMMLDHARREAAETPNAWFVLSDGVSVPPGPYNGAWTVVVFQHNSRDLCRRLVAAVAGELAPGGVFIYQTVGADAFEDEGHVPEDVLREWATAAGLEVEAVVHGEVFGDWKWIVGRRP